MEIKSNEGNVKGAGRVDGSIKSVSTFLIDGCLGTSLHLYTYGWGCGSVVEFLTSMKSWVQFPAL